MKPRLPRLILPAVLATLLGVTLTLAAPARPTPAPPRRAHTPPATSVPAPAKKRPLLPPQAPIDSLFPDITLNPKLPQTFSPAFLALYTPQDWQTYRERFGTEADTLTQKRASAQLEFANKLISAASTQPTPASQPTPLTTQPSSQPATVTPGLRNLLLVRAAAIAYRTTGSFPTTDRAVTQLLATLNPKNPAEVAALWTITNAASRMAVTPKPQRIRYSAIAARANAQLALLLLDLDQLDAAQSLVKLVGYHEGWLKSDSATRAEISAARGSVNRTIALMDYLDKQFPLAVKGDDNASMTLYLWARYVKNYPTLQSEIVTRKPQSPVAVLHQAIVSAEANPLAAYDAAESLKSVAAALPEGLLKQRTLHASLQFYRAFLRAPETANERIKRTLARMATESLLADGARGPSAATAPLAPLLPSSTTQPASTQPTSPTTPPPPATYPASGTESHPAG